MAPRSMFLLPRFIELSFVTWSQFFSEIKSGPFRHGNGDCQFEVSRDRGFHLRPTPTTGSEMFYSDATKIYFPSTNKNYGHRGRVSSEGIPRDAIPQDIPGERPLTLIEYILFSHFPSKLFFDARKIRISRSFFTIKFPERCFCVNLTIVIL